MSQQYDCYLQVLEARTLLCHRAPEKIAVGAPSQRGYIGEIEKKTSQELRMLSLLIVRSQRLSEFRFSIV